VKKCIEAFPMALALALALALDNRVANIPAMGSSPNGQE
jgi:hypothetical protein